MSIIVYDDGYIPDSEFPDDQRKAAKAFRKGRDLLVADGGGYANSIFTLFYRKSRGFTLLMQPDKTQEGPDVAGTWGYAFPHRKDKSGLLAEVAGGKLDLLIVTSDFLGNGKLRDALRMCPPEYVIVDHAENIINKDSAYHRQYRRIPKLIQAFPKRPAILANTTAWKEQDRAGICLALGMLDWKSCAAPEQR